MVEKRLEENRLEVKRIASKIMLEYANFLSHDDIDMWLVFVIIKDTFYDYESIVLHISRIVMMQNNGFQVKQITVNCHIMVIVVTKRYGIKLTNY